MTKFEDFLQKKPRNVEHLDKIQGKFRCKTCTLEVDFAYFSAEKMTIYYYCDDNHESVIEIV